MPHLTNELSLQISNNEENRNKTFTYASIIEIGKKFSKPFDLEESSRRKELSNDFVIANQYYYENRNSVNCR